MKWSGRRGPLLSVALAVTMLFALVAPQSAGAQVSVGISVGFGPPALPAFYQPQATQPNMIWQPGYWGWSPDGYFWVPGTWVQAPQVGLLWTPGYWGWNAGFYNWNQGYWGQTVGYYGGINYGYGYYGSGYRGGRWQGHSFQYNTSVTNVNTSYIHNSYVDRGAYVNQNTISRTSYNGGPNGITARPSSAQLAVANQRHYPMTSAQTAHVAVAQQNRSYLATVNHGTPGQVSVAKPLAANNHPAGFTPVRAEDKVTPTQQRAATAPVERAAAVPQKPVTAPAQHAAARVEHAAAPAQHAAAPVQHAAAPVQHAAPPAQHHVAQAPAQHAPAQHAAPQQHEAAPQHAPAQAPKPHSSPKPIDLVYWNGK